MKPLVPLCLLFGLWLVGCGQKNGSSTKSAPGENPLTAPVDYLGAVGKGKITAEKTIDTAALNQAIQMFNVQEGRYPADLEELVARRYLPQLPKPPYGMKFVYDAKTGTVRVVKQ